MNEHWIKWPNVFDCYNKRILVINLLYKTNKKLFVKDGNGEVVLGDDSDKQEVHIWRFETYSGKFDWHLTDMDFCLNGNSYEVPTNVDQEA